MRRHIGNIVWIIFCTLLIGALVAVISIYIYAVVGTGNNSAIARSTPRFPAFKTLKQELGPVDELYLYYSLAHQEITLVLQSEDMEPEQIVGNIVSLYKFFSEEDTMDLLIEDYNKKSRDFGHIDASDLDEVSLSLMLGVQGYYNMSEIVISLRSFTKPSDIVRITYSSDGQFRDYFTGEQLTESEVYDRFVFYLEQKSDYEETRAHTDT